MRTKEFLAKGKHGNDSRIIRHRHMLRAYILFLVNTGLRVGEARHLIWGDLEERINKLGRRVVTVHVTHSHSKVKKTRTVVGRYTALRALERWKAYLETIGEEWSKDTYIFCNDKGQPIKDFREGFNSVISEADVETDRNGNKLTVYSLRHTYITFRIQFAKNLSIYSLAQNCGTSVQMIEQFYSDAVLAHMWWNLAATQGNIQARKNRDLVEKRMTSSQLEKAQYLAQNFVSEKPLPTETARKLPKTRRSINSNSNRIISASSGSGFAVSSDGYVITNNHVINGCEKVKIHHKGESISASVVTFDPNNDLALLKGDFRPKSFFPLSKNNPELLQENGSCSIK